MINAIYELILFIQTQNIDVILFLAAVAAFQQRLFMN